MSTLEEQLGGSRNVIGGPFGSKLTQKDYTEEGVPVIRGSNMAPAGRWIDGDFAFVSEEKVECDLKSNLAHPGDIIVTQRGTLGQVAIVPDRRGFKRYVISQSQMAVRVPKNKADRDFVYYFLQSPHFAGYVETSTIQTGVPHINLRILRSAPAIWPEKDEQCRIASVLAALDDRIQLNRRMNDTLEAMARGIFRDWFVDFGPTRAKAEGRAPYLVPELWELFPIAIGEIPEGWKAGKVSDIALNIRDGRGADDVPDDERYVGLEHFDRRRLTLWRCGSGSEVTSNKSGFQTGDLLFGKLRPYFHKVAIAPFAGVCSTDVLVIRPKSPDVACLVYLALSESAVIDFVTNASTGTRMPRTNWNTLASYRMAVPDGSIAREFHKIVSPMVQRMTLAAEEAGTLAELRDLLLPRLILGKLRVGDAEKMVAAAV